MNSQKIHQFFQDKGTIIGIVCGVLAAATVAGVLTCGGALLAYTAITTKFGSICGWAASILGAAGGLYVSNAAVPATFWAVAGGITKTSDLSGRFVANNVKKGQAMKAKFVKQPKPPVVKKTVKLKGALTSPFSKVAKAIKRVAGKNTVKPAGLKY